MLVSLKAALELADAKKIALGAFNITSLEVIQAVLEVAGQLNQPVILQFAPVHQSIINLELIGPIMVRQAEQASVPVVVHLDHGEDLSLIPKALDLGFTSVMYDGSMLPFKENIANTKMAVEIAGRYGASVEAEIGSLGRQEFTSVGDTGEELEGCFTNPDQAGEFVKATKVDALACSFGTVHGIYITKPQLDFQRIKDIYERTAVPIVMHGGSGVSDQDFKRCIANGVRKINYYTYLSKAGGEFVKNQCQQQQELVFFHDITLWGIEAMKKDLLHTIQVFSNLI